ncbi:Stealth CR1 domain-containing protein [Chitinibacter sp. S2-10]|uniref:Stealth CR1 domain-containing protein n=1 Tax=Chitinibacter sp. S2-10 TaxID=3373597 RepID=UPI0039778F87
MDKVDIVYLWVNGADPVWQRKRQGAQQQKLDPSELAQYGNVAGRYRDNGELRYNLRALERFFPDHGQIYIVTDAQKPAWLNDHPGVTLIDHAELIPEHALPVFDAGHIESYLHHIPKLSERFIYLNDDIFFGAPVCLTDWFKPESLPVFFDTQAAPEHNEIQPNETALVNASILSKHWLGRQFSNYQHRPWLCAHSPRALLKSVMAELESEAAELFAAVRSTTFRSWQIPPIISDLLLRWMICKGYATAHQQQALYISSCDTEAEQQFAALRSQFGALPFFCINDTCDDCPDHDPRLQAVEQVLQQLLPQPSRFEIPGTV